MASYSWKKAELATEESSPTNIEILHKLFGQLVPNNKVMLYVLDSPKLAMEFISKNSTLRANPIDYVNHGQFNGHVWQQYDAVKNPAPQLRIILDICRNVHMWWAFKNDKTIHIVICRRPKNIAVRDKQLHREDGPAIEYIDGTGIYYRNNVIIPAWIAETPPEKLDPRKISEISNAEVRREFIRIIGIERLCHALEAKVLDTGSYKNDTGTYNYELLLLKVNANNWRYLKMENASIPELYHVEGVENAVTTVREALLFRNSLKESDINDKDGEEWYQQGDVILRPKSKKGYKFFPKKLT